MKKYLLILVAAASLVGCKKKDDNVSQDVVVSSPTITLTGSLFYSINTGGTIPSVSATAYDSVLHESYPTKLDASGIDNQTPGLYVVPITSKNKYGYTSSTVVYIAVTDINPAIDLSGLYKRTANNAPVHVSKVANGLYLTDDVGGAPTLPVPAYFAQLDDTTITLPPQPTVAGTLSAENASVSMMPGDTSFTYIVINGSFGTSQRVFVKQ